MTRSEGVLFDNSDCCEECPDVNPDPPTDSECPYFDIRSGIPICTRPDGRERLIGGGGPGTGIEDYIGQNLIERVEES